MPDIIISATAAQATRFIEARDRYNAMRGTAYTTESFIMLILKQGARSILIEKAMEDARVGAGATVASIEGDLA